MSVFHSPPIAGRIEEDVAIAEDLCEVMIEIAGFVGILQDKNHGTMELSGYGCEEDRCR